MAAFRYRNLHRVSSFLPSLLSGQGCQQCGRATNATPYLIPLAHTCERIDTTVTWRGIHVSRLSTLADISKVDNQESDINSYLRSTFDHAEGPSYHWVNIFNDSKEFFSKDGPFLLVAGLFLDDPPGSRGDQIIMLEKVKLLQQRFPWLHVLGFQSCSSICSKADYDHLVNNIMEDYITFPILLCDKDFPEMSVGSWMLLKGLKDPPLCYGKDIDLSILPKGISDLGEQLNKNAGNAAKLNSTWSKHCEGFKEPYACSFLRNLVPFLPACISADGSGNRIFLSDSNHHRVIIFDSAGTILDVIGSSPGFEDGDFETGKLMRPAASYYDASEDSLYIVDSENHAIRRAYLGRRVLETLYPASNEKGRSGLWRWVLDKLGFGRDTALKSVEFDTEALLFPWHLLKPVNDDLLVMNKRLNSLWILNMNNGVISNVVKGHGNIIELCGEYIMEKALHLKDLSHDFHQQLVPTSYPSADILCSSLLSSFVAWGDHLLICDTVSQRVLRMNRQDGTCSSIELSNFGILGLPYWLTCPLERAFTTGDVYDDTHVDHIQSLALLPGKINVHVTIDIPEHTELVEPLEESCVWRQVRGAAMEVLGMNSSAATTEKVGVAQQWYDELDNLAFEVEPEVSSEEKTIPPRNLDDGKIHISCVINTSPGTSEVNICAPLYLKLQSSLKTCKDTQEKAAIIAEIVKPDRTGKTRDTYVRSLLNMNRDLGDLVFVKPLRVKLRFEIMNPPKAENSRDVILTDSAIDVKVSLGKPCLPKC